MQDNKILVVDDEVLARRSIAHILNSFGYPDVDVAASSEEALKLCERNDYSLLLSDILMPGSSGLELVKQIGEKYPDICCIVITGRSSKENAISAIKSGVFDFVTKPITDFDFFENIIARAMRHSNLLKINRSITQKLKVKNEKLEESFNDLSIAYQILESNMQALHSDLTQAQSLQKAFLQKSIPNNLGSSGFKTACIYKPSDRIGGDFYGVFRLNKENSVVYVGDASGHGVSACLLMALLQHQISIMRLEKSNDFFADPSAVLSHLNKYFHAIVSTNGKFATIIYMLINHRTGYITYSSAGHTPLIAKGLNNNIDLYFSNGKPLGIDNKAEYRNQILSLKDYAYLTMYTDGLIETVHDIDNKYPFNIETLKEIHLYSDKTPQKFVETIYNLFKKHLSGQKQDDDVTILTIRTGTDYEQDDRFKCTDSQRIKKVLAPKTHIKGLQDKLLEIGYNEGICFIRVQGVADWTLAQALSAQLSPYLSKSSKQIILDCENVTYMDSTFFGVLQETVQLASKHNIEVNFYIIRKNIVDDIKELYLKDIIVRIQEEKPLWEYSLEPILHYSPLTESSAKKLILKAHKILAGLSDENEEKFHGIIEQIGRELGTS